MPVLAQKTVVKVLVDASWVSVPGTSLETVSSRLGVPVTVGCISNFAVAAFGYRIFPLRSTRLLTTKPSPLKPRISISSPHATNMANIDRRKGLSSIKMHH